MKNLILSILCVFAVSVSSAFAAKPITFKKGDKVFNPTLSNIGLNSITISHGSKSQSLTRIGLQAAGGYVIKSDVIVMAGVGFPSYSSDDDSTSLFDISAGGRYYLTPNVFATGNLVLVTGSMKEKSSDGESTKTTSSKIQSTDFRLGAGYTYFITKNFAVEPSITYDLGLDTNFSGKKMDIGVLSLNIGFIVKL